MGQSLAITSTGGLAWPKLRSWFSGMHHHRAGSPLACRRGSAAVEFALLAGPFILMCFGFIAANTLFFGWSAMQNNAQYAARMMSTGQIKNIATGPLSSGNTTATTTCSGSLAATQVEYYACQGLPNWATFSVTATLNCAVPSVTVRVAASAFTAGLGDVNNLFGAKTVAAQAVMMKEGTCP